MSAEPSMEEILSSIKRIIAEEGEAPVRARRAPRAVPTPAVPLVLDDEDDDDGSEVLELSDPMPPVRAPEVEAFAPRSAPRVEAVAAPEIEPVADEEPVTMPSASVEAPVSSRAASHAAAPSRPAVEPVEDPILSPKTAEASRSALDNLSRLMVRADAPAGEDNTLEGLVRTMLRPMLREWLDANLPAMVEQMVASEIARITGQHSR